MGWYSVQYVYFFVRLRGIVLKMNLFFLSVQCTIPGAKLLDCLNQLLLPDTFEGFLHGNIFNKAVFCIGEKQDRLVNDECGSWYDRAGDLTLSPISKIGEFRDILEENYLRLAGRKPMSDLIPFILKEERSRIQSEIDGKPLSIVFDGTTRLGEALAVIFCFVMPDTLQTQQRLVRLQMLTKSMSGEEIAREILSTVST